MIMTVFCSRGVKRQIAFSTVRGFDSFFSENVLTAGSDFLLRQNNIGISCYFKFNLSASISNLSNYLIRFWHLKPLLFPVALIINPIDPPTRNCKVNRWGCTVSFIVKKTKGGVSYIYIIGHNYHGIFCHRHYTSIVHAGHYPEKYTTIFALRIF